MITKKSSQLGPFFRGIWSSGNDDFSTGSPWREWAILFVLMINLHNKRILIVQWINPYTAYPTKLKKNCFPYPTSVEILNNKNNFAIYPSKKPFVATFNTKKSSHMGAFFRSQCPLAIRFLALAHTTWQETIFFF